MPANPARLRELAADLEPAIRAAFNPGRLANTPKRRRQASEARIEGRRLQRTQAALRALADLHEADAAPPELAPVTTRKAAYDLLGSRVTHDGGYYDAGNDRNEPRERTPAALALWALATQTAPADMKAERLRRLIDECKTARIPDYFPTPAPLIARMLELAELPERPLVLEPSAGHGAIADAVAAARPGAEVSTIEANPRLREILTLKGYNPMPERDFMEAKASPIFARVIMNPPFSSGQDADHTRRAFDWLAPGGILVSVMSEGTFFRRDSKAAGFKAWLDDIAGEAHRVPSGAFHESGTEVATRIVVAVKSAARGAARPA